MEDGSETKELAMTLVEEALRHPEAERETFLRQACRSDNKLFAEAWSYVQWEKRMQGFLLDPLHPLPANRLPFHQGQILIGRFRIVREIAEGGMGIVWEAFDQKLERRVALKCAKAGFGTHLPPEVRNAREISHPNVCRIFEIHTASTPDGEIDFISMEFLEGETLAERLGHVRLAESKARQIARQLCAGLAEAHRNHLVHGDLKTSNVILTTDAAGTLRAVITDFGLACAANSCSGQVGGTPAYMAPELFRGVRPSVSSDIYALGIILWELRSGRPLADLSLISSTLLAGERPTWKPPPGRGRWARIIARCLDPDPSRRFPNASQVERAFAPSRLRKRALTAAAVLAVASLSGLITYQRATAPAETVRLALLPDNALLSGALLQNTAYELAAIQSSPHTRFRFISLDKASTGRDPAPTDERGTSADLGAGRESVVRASSLRTASHTLRATAEPHGNALTVRASLTDIRSGNDVREWTANYQPAELRYLPAALAGFVTETLHLPPPATGTNVNAAARADYQAGLAALHRDKTVDAARNFMQKAVQADPDSALTWAGLAEAQRLTNGTTGDKIWLDRATHSAQEADKRNPDLPEVHRIDGLLKSNAGWYEQAISEYLRAIELDPANGDNYRRLGQSYESNNQPDDALSAFGKAVQLGPRDYRNHRALGLFYYDQAKYQTAIPSYKRAVELAPDEPGTLYNLGAVYLASGQYAAAEREFRSSLQLNATSITINSLGVVLLYERRDRDAATYFVRVLRTGPDRYLAWMNLGTAYRHLGLRSKSHHAYHKALELAEASLAANPRNSSVRAYLAYLCAQLGDGRRALSEVVQVLQQSPNEADTLSTIAFTYEALDLRRNALALLASAPASVIADINRWPDVADLRRDPRFKQMLTNRSLR